MQEALDNFNRGYFDRIASTPWGNLNGTQKTFGDMDHSYMSNVYWHLRTRRKIGEIRIEADYKLALELRDFIDHKFGSVLDYRPFTQTEVNTLHYNKLVDGDGYISYGDLYVGNVKGSYLSELDKLAKYKERYEKVQEESASVGAAVHQLQESMFLDMFEPAATDAAAVTYAEPLYELKTEVLVNVNGAYLRGMVVRYHDEPKYEVQLLDQDGNATDTTILGLREIDLRPFKS